MTLYTDLDLLDGNGLRPDAVLRLEGGLITELRPRRSGDGGISLAEGDERALVCPGFLDLQVNGGAGFLLGDCQSPADISAMAAVHRAGGTLGLLPTLISDKPARTARIIDLVASAAADDAMILGLHLEGPHLAVAGAHDPARLRPMTKGDLALYLDAARRLPHLMITLAPEQVSRDQIAALAEAGVVLSLGHSACSYDAALSAFAAGVRGVTHLFNAMSGLHHRDPGLVGAALDRAEWIGLIADTHHVHPAALRLAMALRPDAVYLITDAMAVAGTEAAGFTLCDREITRAGGRLTLADGTLAGADITMMEALRRLAEATGRPFLDLLPLAFDTPHRMLTGKPARIRQGAPARLLHLRGDQLVATCDGETWRPI